MSAAKTLLALLGLSVLLVSVNAFPHHDEEHYETTHFDFKKFFEHFIPFIFYENEDHGDGSHIDILFFDHKIKTDNGDGLESDKNDDDANIGIVFVDRNNDENSEETDENGHGDGNDSENERSETKNTDDGHANTLDVKEDSEIDSEATDVNGHSDGNDSENERSDDTVIKTGNDENAPEEPALGNPDDTNSDV